MTKYISSWSDLSSERNKSGVESLVDLPSHELLAAVLETDGSLKVTSWSQPIRVQPGGIWTNDQTDLEHVEEALDPGGGGGELLKLGQLLIAVLPLPVLHTLLDDLLLGHFLHDHLHALLHVLLGQDGSHVRWESGQVGLRSGLAPVARVVQPAELGEHAELSWTRGVIYQTKFWQSLYLGAPPWTRPPLRQHWDTSYLQKAVSDLGIIR